MTKFVTILALLGGFVQTVLAAATNNAPTLRCQPGWRAELIAQAPAISAPTVICTAPDGRIFLGQDLMDMGSPTDKPGDRILCIHPDGKITVFATNLYAVFGLQYIDGKVYVHHTPKFSVFDDDHSVGTHRVDLITNENPHPWLPSFNDHIPSGFHLAMDGYFYISTGDKGILGSVGKDGRKIEMHGGGIYRMRPDGTGLEVYCTGTRNHLDIAINAEDEMFTYDNTDDGGGWWARVTHMVDGGFYGYPYDFKPQRPYTLWTMMDYGTGAATDIVSYNEDALPEEYRGNLFLDEWAGAQIYRLKTKRVGSTYEVTSRVQYRGDALLPTTQMGATDLDFVTRGAIGDSFRPVGICVTPDGMGFYVTDWGLSGWKTGEVIGRVFKITYTGKSLAAPKPKWFIAAATGQKFKASTGELIRALSHPAQSVRMVAQRRLVERRNAAQGKLASLLKDAKAEPYARWSALWAMDAIDGGKGGHRTILAALKDRDPTVQAQAARELGTRQSRDAVTPLITMLDSTNEMLRFRAATALGRIGDRRAAMPLRVALAQTNLFARYAAFKALNRIGRADPKAWPQIVDGMDSVKPPIREGTFFALRETYDPALAKALNAFLIIPTMPMEPRTNALDLLSSLYEQAPAWNGDWWNTMPVNSPPPAKSVKWEGSPVVADAMRAALQDASSALRQIAFDWVRTSHDTNAGALLRGMFDRETDITMRAAIVRALPGLNDPKNRALIGSILKSPQPPLPLLEAALADVQTLGGNEWDDDLIHLSDNPANDQILGELFQIFGKNKLSRTAPLLGKNLSSPNLALRQTAASALHEIGGEAAIAQFMPGLDNPAVDIRRQSIEAMGALRAKLAVPRLIQLASNGVLSVPAIQALAQVQDIAALDIYLEGLASKNAALRSQCRTAVEALRDAALPLIEAKLATTNGLPDDTVATLRQVYQNNTAAKKGLIFKIKVKVIPIAEYQSFAASHPGNSAKGKKIFSDVNGVNCVRCHAIEGYGGHIGPDLSGIKAKYGRPQIIESVLYPSKLILDGYQQVFFRMKNDDDYSGIVHTENTNSVTIIDSLGKTNILQKSNIKTRKISQISLMPEGLQTGLSDEEFSDLIAFVENPKAPLSVTALTPKPAMSAPEPIRSTPPPRVSEPEDFLTLPPLPIDAPEKAPPAQPIPSPAPPQFNNTIPPATPPPSPPRSLRPAFSGEFPPSPPGFPPLPHPPR